MKNDELIFGRILDEQEKMDVAGGQPIFTSITLPTVSEVPGNGTLQNFGTDDSKTYGSQSGVQVTVLKFNSRHRVNNSDDALTFELVRFFMGDVSKNGIFIYQGRIFLTAAASKRKWGVGRMLLLLKELP